MLLVACGGPSTEPQLIRGSVGSFGGAVKEVRLVDGLDLIASARPDEEGVFLLAAPPGDGYRIDLLVGGDQASSVHPLVRWPSEEPMRFSVCGAGPVFEMGAVRGTCPPTDACAGAFGQTAACEENRVEQCSVATADLQACRAMAPAPPDCRPEEEQLDTCLNGHSPECGPQEQALEACEAEPPPPPPSPEDPCAGPREALQECWANPAPECAPLQDQLDACRREICRPYEEAYFGLCLQDPCAEDRLRMEGACVPSMAGCDPVARVGFLDGGLPEILGCGGPVR